MYNINVHIRNVCLMTLVLLLLSYVDSEISLGEQHTTVDAYKSTACTCKQLTKTVGLKRPALNQQLCIAQQAKFAVSIEAAMSLYSIIHTV